MTSNELVQELRAAANGAADGGKVLTLNLFGIEFSEHLKDENLPDLVERAGISRSFSSELRRGMRLSEFVALKR